MKRGADTRMRREVVGQMLDYAANAAATWSMQNIRAALEEEGAHAQDALRTFVDPDETLDADSLEGEVSELWNKLQETSSWIAMRWGHAATRSDLLACQFEELSVDTPLNRVLKAAVSRLASTSRSDANQRRLAELTARFEFVGDSPNPFAEPVRLDRTNTAFHRLYRLARVLLAGDWQSTTTGESEGFGLLFPMNDLFEEFVGRTLRLALAPRFVSLQDTGKFALEGDRQRLFSLRPDIVVDGDIVIDTKWKQLKAGEATLGVSQADVYQMLAYGRAYEARRLVLLYPWDQALAETGVLRRWRVPGTETVLEVATVDAGRPERVAQTVREIVDGPITEHPIALLASAGATTPAPPRQRSQSGV